MRESPILDDILKVASNNYTLDPNTVLQNITETFVRALRVHMQIVKSMNEEKGQPFDEMAVTKEICKSLEKEILAPFKDKKPQSNLVSLKRIL